MNYTLAALLDIHEGSHAGFKNLLNHCLELTAAQADQEFEGFGGASVRAQLHHVLEAERYWLGVIRGEMLADDTLTAYPTIHSLIALEEEVSATTHSTLAALDTDALNTARTMTTWGDKQHELIAARILLRTQTHLFHHQGQVTAMCRQLGHPLGYPSGLDFPVKG